MGRLSNKIGFIGAGNMGEAIISSLIKSRTTDPSQIFIYEIRKDHADNLQKKYGLTVLNDTTDLFATCQVLIFAVKPQAIDDVLSKLSMGNAFQQLHGRKLLISIVAGTKIKKYEDRIYVSMDDNQKSQTPILRVMPNTPALIGEGMSGLCANAFADSNDFEIARAILSAMGKVFECQEKDMDAITALSGSGPAYCFYFVEAMIEAGVRLGFEPDTAADLTITTFKGALSLLEHQKESPEQLRRKVTSPGGTTEAAVKELDKQDIKSAIIQAVLAAARRSEELSV